MEEFVTRAKLEQRTSGLLETDAAVTAPSSLRNLNWSQVPLRALDINDEARYYVVG